MRIQILILLALFIPNFIFGQEVTILSSELNKFPNIRDFCISDNEDEAYFTIQSPNQDLSQIVRVENNRWENPSLLPFCDGYSYLEPFLSSDGKRLYFASNRPKNETDTIKSDFDIWYVERENKKSKWSKPINLGPQVNSENDEFYPTLANNGNLYFTMDAKTGLGKDDIYYCKWNGIEYTKPILLNNNINSDGYEFNAFISKDESFIIYTKYNAKGGLGSGDLYISKKDENGEWKSAENMGNAINTKYMEYCPFYNSKTNTLYFTSRRANLSPKKFKNIKQYLEKITGSENGLSKIYKCKIKI
ncbi:MAG: hypothetical protein REI64_16380 [Pedobacter sp.]|uniref:TolB family protein n=1 Tax=Pedobacter sp. TaxID=1411316 RepID=UPI002807A8A5|nr:hypothetical protein [Pedobacter sp.]MDQ8006381.1 hypothetical protein [Pedobacter sp.]